MASGPSRAGPAFVHLTDHVAPDASPEDDAIPQLDRLPRRQPDAGIAEETHTVEGDDDGQVRARGGLGVADTTEDQLGVVAEGLEDGVEDPGVLEAVATSPAADELVPDGGQADTGVLPEQHVDGVEGEGGHVRQEESREGGMRRGLRHRSRPLEVVLQLGVGHDPESATSRRREVKRSPVSLPRAPRRGS